MSDEVIIYTKQGCPYCAAAKEDMKSKGIAYTEYDVHADRVYLQKAVELSGGQKVVPIIVRGGKVEVGFGGS